MLVRLIQFGIFLLFAVPLSIVDMRSYRLPDVLTLGGFAALALTTLLLSSATLLGSTLAAGAAVAFFLIVRKVGKGLGFGDVKYAALIGFFTGPQGLSPAMFIAAVVGALFVGGTYIIARRPLRARIPFGPFLTLGAVGSFILESMNLRLV